MNDKYISPFKISKQFDITSNTLRTWAENDKIRFIRINEKGKRLYHVEDIKKIFHINEPKRIIICYSRVSSNHQKEDLIRQQNILLSKYPEAVHMSDIGSGLNWKRKEFNRLLEQVYNNNVEKIVVSYKDRLARFGIELIEWIFVKHNTKLEIINELNEPNENKTNEQELAEDLFSIINVFVAKNNGLRASKNSKIRKQLKEIKES